MPQGKGTYGSQVGRPSKNGKKKYYGGGSVDPFSTRNPGGVPAQKVEEVMEQQNMANEGMPVANAQERSQTYQMGGEVLDFDESSVSDISLEPTTETPSIAEEGDEGSGEVNWIQRGRGSKKDLVRQRILDRMESKEGILGKSSSMIAKSLKKKWGL